MTLFRGGGRMHEGGPEAGGRAHPAVEEKRQATRTSVLGTGTLACRSCDAPIAPGVQPLRLADRLVCPFCETRGYVRDFLSIAAPTRPAHVILRVAERSPR
jgi:hypothetical protein